MLVLKKLGMNSAMKRNSIDKNNIIKMFTMSILRTRKKKTTCKKTSCKLSKIKGPIQVLANTLEKHNYINLTFETNANNS
jgi:hypothetical protein